MCKVNFCQTPLILLAELSAWAEEERLRNLPSGFRPSSGGAIMNSAWLTEKKGRGDDLKGKLVVTIEFRVRTTSGEHYAERDFVHLIRGRISAQSENCAETEVGRLTATLVQFDEAIDCGITADRIGDGLDGSISEYWERLFDPENGHLKEKLQNEFEALGCDLLTIDCMELWRKFRGCGIGRMAIERTIQVFGCGCGLVACKPWPLQFTPAASRNRKLLKRLDAPELGKEQALLRLREYWSGLGFRRVGDTDIFARSMALKSASLRETSR